MVLIIGINKKIIHVGCQSPVIKPIVMNASVTTNVTIFLGSKRLLIIIFESGMSRKTTHPGFHKSNPKPKIKNTVKQSKGNVSFNLFNIFPESNIQLRGISKKNVQPNDQFLRYNPETRNPSKLINGVAANNLFLIVFIILIPSLFFTNILS